MTTPAPGSKGSSPPQSAQTVSRAESIKALTHPLRVKLLDLLCDGDERTATQCAQVVGESVASCSFHLRQLEKYGHAERAEPRGKERPWRIKGGGYRVFPNPDDGESWQAAGEFASVWLDEQFGKMQHWLEYARHDDPEWVLASTQNIHDLWLTKNELTELSRRVGELTEEFVARNHDPALRPKSSRRAHLFAATWADVPPAETGDA